MAVLCPTITSGRIDQLLCECPNPVRITAAPAKFDPEIAAFCPPELCELTPECCHVRPRTLVTNHQHADAPYPLRLLCASYERPTCRRTADKFDELAPPHCRPRG